MDGTSRRIDRPGYFQRAFYSGHKRQHCLQFLSVTAPDGLILYTYGPTNGAHQDNFLVNESGLNSQLEHLSTLVSNDKPYCIYGDPIFARTEYIQKAMPRMERAWQHEIFNKAMNSARVSIEHIFGIVVRQWAYLDFHKKQNLNWTRPALSYLNAQFLTNCLTCMYEGNQVSEAFDMPPPTLMEYLYEFTEHPTAPHVDILLDEL